MQQRRGSGLDELSTDFRQSQIGKYILLLSGEWGRALPAQRLPWAVLKTPYFCVSGSLRMVFMCGLFARCLLELLILQLLPNRAILKIKDLSLFSMSLHRIAFSGPKWLVYYVREYKPHFLHLELDQNKYKPEYPLCCVAYNWVYFFFKSCTYSL